MEEYGRGRAQREQFQSFVDDWAKLANGFIVSSAELTKRMMGQSTGGQREVGLGPLQDFWMTMASAAGDLAELSYKWVQAVDGLAGFSAGRRPHTEGTPGSSKESGKSPADSDEAE